ncbi:hypothetical protein [Clostridioides difficile]
MIMLSDRQTSGGYTKHLNGADIISDGILMELYKYLVMENRL